jgi:hypothetical protein
VKKTKRKARVVWGVHDCKWGTIRTLHHFRYEAENERACKSCKIVKFVEPLK